MSNNKQSMKLYTEDQLKKAIKLAQECEHECGGVYFDYTEKEIIDELTPIELPSDKDTAHLQWIYDRMSNIHGENENYDYMLKFKEIIEQLKKGGNNEQQ